MRSSRVNRRRFLASSVGAAAAAWTLSSGRVWAESQGGELLAGEGTVEITPELGLELAGFHRPPGQERLITGIRQATFVRAIVLKKGETTVALVSLDLIGVSKEYADGVRQSVEKATGIPAGNVHLCVTHSHSTPTFLYLRQWGKMPDEYMKTTHGKIVEAVAAAQKDVAPAKLYAGSANAVGGNFNRTTGTWKTDLEWNEQASDIERWLDTLLHVLRFERSEKPDLVWYHFSAHTVCYTDGLAGPDWTGGVSDKLRESHKVTPSFLQGHAGDVNPGDGTPWIGDPTETVDAVYKALVAALDSSKEVSVDEIEVVAEQFEAAYDLEQLKRELEQYRTNPEACTSGVWVDAPFAADWYEAASKWDLSETGRQTPMSALRLGSVGIVFHATELYSYYGLAIRKKSPFEQTIVVGYTDDLIGYVTDPAAYTAGEYAAIVVPKIVDMPPFKTTTAHDLEQAAVALLKRLA